MKLLAWIFLSFFVAHPTEAKTFETFDGQVYNGLYYPLVDIIEWGEQYGDLPHMEFHIHNSREKPSSQKIDLSVVSGKKNGKPVLWIMYDLKYRGERVCRHVIAPSHFGEDMKLFVYLDESDPDYDNYFVSSYAMSGKNLKPYTMPAYEACADENASNKPEAAEAQAAPVTERAPASVPPSAEKEKKDGKNIGLDYDNQAVPFSF